MNVGLMWFNPNPNTPLAEKIREAAEYYESKYEEKPNLCCVNQAMLEKVGQDEIDRIQGVAVRSMREMLPGHLWIGVESVDPIPNGHDVPGPSPVSKGETGEGSNGGGHE